MTDAASLLLSLETDMGREGFEPSTLGLREALPGLGLSRSTWNQTGLSHPGGLGDSADLGGSCCPSVAPAPVCHLSAKRNKQPTPPSSLRRHRGGLEERGREARLPPALHCELLLVDQCVLAG